MPISLLRTFLILTLLFTPSLSQAQLAQNLFIGNPKALSLGNSVTADPPGIDSIHFNPAGLVRLKQSTKNIKFLTGAVNISGEFNRNDAYRENEDFLNTTDPYADSKSEIDKFAIYLPFLGITETPILAAALGGAAYVSPDNNLAIGTAVYAPLVLGYTRDDDDPGIFYGRSIGISRITFLSPTISLRISDSFSFGVGIGLSYVGTGLDLSVRLPILELAYAHSITGLLCGQTDIADHINICEGSLSPYLPIFDLEADLEKNVSFTYNLGFLWDVTPWLTMGMVYQSPASDTLEGDVNVKLSDNVANFVSGVASSNPLFDEFARSLELIPGNYQINRKGKFVLELPQHLAIGLSMRVTPSLKVNVDLKWTEMSAWDEWKFTFDEPVELLGLLETPVSNADGLTIPRGYEDTLDWSIGLEYQYSDQLRLRFGYEPRSSGIPKDKRDFLIPIGDSILYSVGFAYKYDKDTTLEFALGFMNSEEYIPAGSSTNGNDPDLHAEGLNPSAGLDVSTSFQVTLFEFSYETKL